MTDIFDGFPREKGGWFPWPKAMEWRRCHETDILEAMKAAERLEALKTQWVDHRGCSGNCESCDTIDWCLFTIQEEMK